MFLFPPCDVIIAGTQIISFSTPPPPSHTYLFLLLLLLSPFRFLPLLYHHYGNNVYWKIRLESPEAKWFMTNTHATRSNTLIFFGYCEQTRYDEMLFDKAHGWFVNVISANLRLLSYCCHSFIQSAYLFSLFSYLCRHDRSLLRWIIGENHVSYIAEQWGQHVVIFGNL